MKPPLSSRPNQLYGSHSLSGRSQQSESARGFGPGLGRVIAALIMGLLLLLLSGALHTAAAAATGFGLSYLWATWLGAIVVTLLITFTAPTGRIAWGMLCALNGVASTGLTVIAVLQMTGIVPDRLVDHAGSLGLGESIGGALGGALLSAALGIIGLVIVTALLVAPYVVLDGKKHRSAL